MVNTLYEDEYILVIDKPPGLVTTPSETEEEQTLAEMLQQDFGINLERGGLVHRLDKDTSGVLLVAKTKQAFENLPAQFKQRKVKKEYLVLVHGIITERGVVDASIARNPGNREKFTILEKGREAVTEYKPLKQLTIDNGQLIKIFSDFNKIQLRKLEKMRYGIFTLLSCQPQTGRTHQIRVHLKYIGHPIVADEKYVGRKVYRLDKRWCPRQFLHAKRLGFYHPATGEWMEVDSPLAEDLKKALWITFLYNWP